MKLHYFQVFRLKSPAAAKDFLNAVWLYIYTKRIECLAGAPRTRENQLLMILAFQKRNIQNEYNIYASVYILSHISSTVYSYDVHGFVKDTLKVILLILRIGCHFVFWNRLGDSRNNLKEKVMDPKYRLVKWNILTKWREL